MTDFCHSAGRVSCSRQSHQPGSPDFFLSDQPCLPGERFSVGNTFGPCAPIRHGHSVPQNFLLPFSSGLGVINLHLKPRDEKRSRFRVKSNYFEGLPCSLSFVFPGRPRVFMPASRFDGACAGDALRPRNFRMDQRRCALQSKGYERFALFRTGCARATSEVYEPGN